MIANAYLEDQDKKSVECAKQENIIFQNLMKIEDNNKKIFHSYKCKIYFTKL